MPPSDIASSPPAAGESRRLSQYLDHAPPCLRWADLPTPIERLPWLEAGRNVACFIKRDDRSSSLYGGGKVRKLEFELADPRHQTTRPVVSIGGFGSHSLLSLALFLRRQRRRLHALVFDQVVTHHARQNLAVLASLDTQFWSTRTRLGLGLSQLAYRTYARPEVSGVAVAAGASSALGSLGFVEAGLELAAQIEAGQCPRPDRIYITAGSAGSSAGLALGLALAGVRTQLRLISAVEPLLFNRWLYRLKLAAVWRELRRRGPRQALPSSATGWLQQRGVDIEIDHRQVGPGYAVPTAAGQAMVATAAQRGLHLETTYTAKCVAALHQDLERETVPPNSTVLFWHTHADNELAPHVRPGWEESLPPRLRRVLDASRPALEPRPL
ncbi:MAG: pyridoxal-phosphate dependent enzyme [Myxococcales bacterium FL481]|nr:MAG: pyridoxal-phosphate dependent enzyme [Myxococcales bacterium FL481]